MFSLLNKRATTRITTGFCCILWLLLGSAISTHAEESEPVTNSATSTDNGNDSGKDLPPRVDPNLVNSRNQDVVRHLALHQRSQELVPLEVDNQAFHGLFLPARHSEPQGAILILHDNGQHGHWPNIVAPLREEMPDYGWATLSIGLPDTPITRLMTRDEYSAEAATETTTEQAETASTEEEIAAEESQAAVEQKDSNGLSVSSAAEQELSANEPALPPLTSLPPLPESSAESQEEEAQGPSAADIYQAQMLGRIDSAIAYLNKNNQFNIVLIATGHSATWAVAWLEQHKLGSSANSRGFSLILVDALDDAYAPIQLNAGLEQLDMPILDLITAFNRNQPFTNVQRQGAMKRNKRSLYQQIKVPTFNLVEDYGNHVTRRVRGWVRNNAVGSEVAVKE